VCNTLFSLPFFSHCVTLEPTKKPEDGNLIATEMGMHYFMRLIGDESQASQPIVRIPSLYENGSTVEVPIQHHPTIFVLPGIEGTVHNSYFQYVLQALSLNLIHEIKNNTNGHNVYYILFFKLYKYV